MGGFSTDDILACDPFAVLTDEPWKQALVYDGGDGITCGLPSGWKTSSGVNLKFPAWKMTSGSV